MKLASLKAGGRDGTLVVVSRDLSEARRVPEIAPTLQQALDDWASCGAEAAAVVGQALKRGSGLRQLPLRSRGCAAPLPRAYQWADGSAYVNHVELVRRARGATLPESFWTDPLMYQGGSDTLLGAARRHRGRRRSPWHRFRGARWPSSPTTCRWRISAEAAAAHIRLLMLVNDVSLRNLIPGELAKGFGFFQSKPASAFSPVAVTPDELGSAWRESKLHRPLLVHLNGQLFGRPDAGTDMTFDFARLIAHAARTRSLAAGSIIGSGTISNRRMAGRGGRSAEGGTGYACIAEQRSVETITRRQAGDAVPRIRRPGAHRDARRGGRQHLRRHRAACRARWQEG